MSAERWIRERLYLLSSHLIVTPPLNLTPPLSSSGVLLEKVQRWYNLTSPCTPQYSLGAQICLKDIRDIVNLLKWFVNHDQNIYLSAYDNKPKGEMLVCIMRLYRIFAVVRDPLERSLTKKDFISLLKLLKDFRTDKGQDQTGDPHQEKDYKREKNDELGGSSAIDGKYELDEEYKIEPRSPQYEFSENWMTRFKMEDYVHTPTTL